MRRLERLGFSVKGIEFSKTPVKLFCETHFKARYNSSDRTYDDSVQIYNQNLTELPFPDNNFDLVTSFEVLEHVPEQYIEQIISEIVRVTRRYFIGSFPACRAGGDPDKPKPAHVHINLHGRKWWDAEFSKHGCKPDLKLAQNLADRFKGRPKRQNQSRMKKNLILKKKQGFKRRCEFDFNRAFGMPYDELRGIYVFSCPKNATRSS